MLKWIFLLYFIFQASLAIADNSFFSKKAELNRVSQKIQELQKNITLDQKQQQQLETELKNLEINIGHLGIQINELNEAIGKDQQKLAKLKSTQKHLSNKLQEQQTALSEQLRASFQLHSLHPLKVILNQDNPTTVERHLYYYQLLAKLRIQMINNTNETLEHLKANLKLMMDQQNHLKQLLNKKQLQQEAHQHSQLRRQQLLTTLHQNVQTKQQELNILLANQHALQNIISELKDRPINIGESRPFDQLRGKLHWPIRGELIANYGSLLDVGDQRLNGVILKAKEGSPVHAIAPGKVIFATWLRGFGLLIIIHHGNNFMSLYGRNHALFAKVGDKVNTGDMIATTGNSGGFKSASLYFEIRQNGQPVNPNLWCS